MRMPLYLHTQTRRRHRTDEDGSRLAVDRLQLRFSGLAFHPGRRQCARQTIIRRRRMHAAAILVSLNEARIELNARVKSLEGRFVIVQAIPLWIKLPPVHKISL